MPDQVYDKGFKRELTKRKYFLNFLRRYVNLPLSYQFEKEDLILYGNETQGKQLKELRSDIIFYIQKGEQKIYFYVILELQTKIDFTMPYRMLEYITARIEKNFTDADELVRERKGYRIPAVVPIVFYSGRGKWSAAKSFRDYTYLGDQFGNHILNFEYYLVSLRDLPESLLQEVNGGLDIILWFAKYWLLGQFDKAFNLLKDEVPELPSDDRPDVAEFIMDIYGDYMENTSKERIYEYLVKGDAGKVEAVLDDLHRSIFEVEEKGKREGIEEGKREGIEEGKREGMKEVARNMLHDGTEISFIMKYTHLSASEIEELKNE